MLKDNPHGLLIAAPSCHVALDDIHHTFGNLNFAFLSSVFESSSVRVMTKRIAPFPATHVTNLKLPCQLPPNCFPS